VIAVLTLLGDNQPDSEILEHWQYNNDVIIAILTLLGPAISNLYQTVINSI
jgi:hypothetical protein